MPDILILALVSTGCKRLPYDVALSVSAPGQGLLYCDVLLGSLGKGSIALYSSQTSMSIDSLFLHVDSCMLFSDGVWTTPSTTNAPIGDEAISLDLWLAPLSPLRQLRKSAYNIPYTQHNSTDYYRAG